MAFARGGKAKPISKSIKTGEARAAIPVDRELIDHAADLALADDGEVTRVNVIDHAACIRLG